jgi:hypothetical protein
MPAFTSYARPLNRINNPKRIYNLIYSLGSKIILQSEGINKLISTSKIKNRIHKAKNFILNGLRTLEIDSNPHSNDLTPEELGLDLYENITPKNKKAIATTIVIEIINKIKIYKFLSK